MLRTTFIYLIIRVANGLLALGAIYYLTHQLSAKEYGLYSLGISAIGLISAIFFQWIAIATGRLYFSYSKNFSLLLYTAYRLYGYVAILLIGITFFYIVWKPAESKELALIIIVLIGSFSMGWHTLWLQITNAMGQSLRYGALTIARTSIALIVAIILVQLNFGGIGAILAMVVAIILSTSIFSGSRIFKYEHASKEISKEIVKYGLPLTLTYLATMIIDVSDRFMIGLFVDLQAVAEYSAPYDLIQQTVGAVLSVTFLAFAPKILKAWEDGGVEAARKAIKPQTISILLLAPIIMGIFCGLNEQISQLMFGGDINKQAANIMPLIAFAITACCIKSYLFDIGYQLQKKTRIQLAITIVMAIVNIILNLLLITRYGNMGAAASTAISFLLGAILSWWYCRDLNLFDISLKDVFISILSPFYLVALIKYTEQYKITNEIYFLFIQIIFLIFLYLFFIIVFDYVKIRTKLIPELINIIHG